MPVERAAVEMVEASARRIEGDGAPTLEEGWLRAEGVRLDMSGGFRLRVDQLRLRITITEVELNRALETMDLGPVRNASAAILTGRVRLTGRYKVVGGLAAPFTLVAGLEPRAGLNVALDVQELSVVGVPNPAIIARAVEDRLNARVAEALAQADLPFPARLEAITLEPGRVTIGLAGSLDLWRPNPAQRRIGE